MFAAVMVRLADGADDATAAAVARNAREFRRMSGMTQSDVAEGAAMRRATVLKMEKTGRVELGTIIKAAALFGVTIDTMLDQDQERADALFLASQVRRLTPRALEIFHGSLADRADDDKIRPERRPSKGSKLL